MATVMNLLAETIISESGKTITRLNIGESLVYALLGFAVTFLGIVILIFFVWLYGKIIKSVRQNVSSKKKPAPAPAASEVAEEEGIPAEVRAAIVAAIAAYYEGESSSCEFKVKRIKRL